MNRSNFALFVALLMHLLILLIFWVLGSILPEIKKPPLEEVKKIKVSLKELPKPIKKALPKNKKLETTAKVKEVIKPPEVAQPIVKGSQLKEIVKRPPIKYTPKLKIKTPKLNPKPIQKTKPKKKVLEKKKTQKIEKKIFIPLVKEEKKKSITEKKKTVDTPMNWLYEDKAKYEKPKSKLQYMSGSMIGKNIDELYGNKFNDLSQGQQEYILSFIGQVRYTVQPVIQRLLNLSSSFSSAKGVYIIEFYLHPNGDMSDFKFLQKSGNFKLEDITKTGFEYSYGKFPRPKEKTLIRFKVMYN